MGASKRGALTLLVVLAAAILTLVSRTAAGAPGSDEACFLVQLSEELQRHADAGEPVGYVHVHKHHAAVNKLASELLSEARNEGFDIIEYKVLAPVFDGFDVQVPAAQAEALKAALLRKEGRVLDVAPCATFADAVSAPRTYSKRAAKHAASVAATETETDNAAGPGARRFLASSWAVDGVPRLAEREAARRHRRALVDAGAVPMDGSGTRIGLIGVGVDYSNPALGGCFGPVGGCKIVRGYDFSGDDSRYVLPDADPMLKCPETTNQLTEVVGHLSAPLAQGGIAPGAELALYKMVVDCRGDNPLQETSNYVWGFLRALQAAYYDGNDVVLVASSPYFRTTIKAYARMAELGVLLVQYQGDPDEGAISYDTPFGAFPSLPAADGVLRVMGARLDYGFPFNATARTNINLFSNSSSFVIDLAYTSDTRSIDASFANIPITTTLSLRASRTSETSGCAASDYPPDVAGKLVLVRRGTCGFTAKAYAASLAGAAGMIFYNRESPSAWVSVAVVGADIFRQYLDLPGTPVPTLTVSGTVGAAMLNAILGGADVRIAAGSIQPNLVPTSRRRTGMPMAMDASLNITATISSNLFGPLFSTLSLNSSNFRLIGNATTGRIEGAASYMGSQPAAAVTAGRAAVLLGALRAAGKPATATDVIRRLLNTARPVDFIVPNATVESPFYFGAGAINATAAALTSVTAFPPSLVLRTGEAQPRVTLTLMNEGTSSVTYSVVHAPSLSYQLVGPDVVQYGTAPSRGRMPRTNISAALSTVKPGTEVTVQAGKSVTLTLDFTVPSSLLGASGLISGYVRLVPSDSAVPALSVPYTGFSSPYNKVPLFASPRPLNILPCTITDECASYSIPYINGTEIQGVPVFSVSGDGRALNALLAASNSSLSNATRAAFNSGNSHYIFYVWRTTVPVRLVAYELVDNSTGFVMGALNATEYGTVQEPLMTPAMRLSTAYLDTQLGEWMPIPPGIYRARLTVGRIRAAGDPVPRGKRAKVAALGPNESLTTPPFQVVW